MHTRGVCAALPLALLTACVAPQPRSDPPLPDAEALGVHAMAVLRRGDFVFECDPEKARMWRKDFGSLRVIAACDGYAGAGFETPRNRMMAALVTPELTVALLQHMVGGKPAKDAPRVVYSTVIDQKDARTRCQLAGANPLHSALLALDRAGPAERREALVRVLAEPGVRLAAAGTACEHVGFLAGAPRTDGRPSP